MTFPTLSPISTRSNRRPTDRQQEITPNNLSIRLSRPRRHTRAHANKGSIIPRATHIPRIPTLRLRAGKGRRSDFIASCYISCERGSGRLESVAVAAVVESRVACQSDLGCVAVVDEAVDSVEE